MALSVFFLKHFREIHSPFRKRNALADHVPCCVLWASVLTEGASPTLRAERCRRGDWAPSLGSQSPMSSAVTRPTHISLKFQILRLPCISSKSCGPYALPEARGALVRYHQQSVLCGPGSPWEKSRKLKQFHPRPSLIDLLYTIHLQGQT